MPPLPLAAILVPSLIQAGVGIWQTAKANKLADKDRPLYQKPEAVTKAENILSQLAFAETPGLTQAKEDIQSNYATIMNRAKETTNNPAALLGYQTNIGTQQQRALNRLNEQNISQQTAQRRALSSFLASTGAGYENKEWEMNKLKPFEEAMYASAMMREGGMQNIFTGLQSGINLGLQSKYLDALTDALTKDEINTGIGKTGKC